uniref:Uncharacterized protein n=1 Tax=Fagus sylvatica TaxID=28930 RepID=A0A2N9EGU9_FAGSY
MAYTHMVLENCQVSPPQGSLPTASLPLTFFDIPWLGDLHVKCLYFYEFPHPTHHFTKTILPTLKNSLSLTLHHFFPLVGNLMCPPPPTKPYILYNNGDSIPLTIAECTVNFNHFIGNHPRDVIEFDQLVPKLPPIHISNETFVIPLLALQVTILPNSGICIGITNRHVVDGLTSILFMKSWASIVSGRTCLEKFLPYYDRDVIKDTNGVEAVLLDEYFRMRSSWKDFILGNTNALPIDHVQAKFVLSPSTNRNAKKAQDKIGALNSSDVDEVHYFVFPADCRDRLEYPVPKTYFGNCLALCVSEAKKSELVATNGVAVAATAIDKAISKLQSGPLKGAERWISDLMNLLKLGRMCTVTGSPSLGFYETDFGWGSPKKVEMVNQQTKNISLSECGDEKGGIEVGLMQTKSAMDTFSSIFEQSLNFLN